MSGRSLARSSSSTSSGRGARSRSRSAGTTARSRWTLARSSARAGREGASPFSVPLDLVLVGADGVRPSRSGSKRKEARLAVRVATRLLRVVSTRGCASSDGWTWRRCSTCSAARASVCARRQAAAALAKPATRPPRGARRGGVGRSPSGGVGGGGAGARQIGGPDAATALVDLAATPHARVRRAVVEALGATRRREGEPALRARAQSDASWLVEAEALRALGELKDAAPFDLLVDRLGRASWNDVVAAAAVDALGRARDPRGVPHVLRATRYGHPARVRRAALHALVALAPDRATRERLEELLDDADASLRLEVARALGELGDAKAEAPSGGFARDDPRAARDARGGARLPRERHRAVRALGDRVEKLASENQESRRGSPC